MTQRGTDFLDSLPAHWALQPALSLARVLTSNVDKISVAGQLPVYLCNYTDVYYSDEITADREFMLATATKVQATVFAVRAGDVAITKDSETADDIGISAYVPRSIPDTVYGYHLAIYRPYDIRYGKFLKWLFDSSYAKAYFETRTFGVTRVGLSQNTLRYFRIPTPPPDEAKAISDYLDRETAEIDAFVADQEELIRLLHERRRATISRAVTKGLDADVPMKTSGNQWIDEVPADWTVNRFSRCVRVISGQVDPKSQRYIDMVLIAPNHVESGTGRLIELETAREQGADSGKYLVAKGQVVYSKIRPALAKAIIAPVSCLCSADMYGLDGNPGDLKNAFIRWYLLGQDFTNYAIDQSARVAMPKLNQDTLGAAPICYPSLDEQERICAFLEEETEQIDSAIQDAKRAIGLLIERRASLITAAVTGKIDVRRRVRGA